MTLPSARHWRDRAWRVVGNNTKSHIFGDWLYQSPSWRFSKTAELRAHNLTDQGLLTDRPLSEIDYCLRDDYVMPFNAYDPKTDPGRNRFWAMVSDLQKAKNSLNASNQTSPGTWFWYNTHCFPWEYAGLCANLWDANAALHGKDVPSFVKEAFLEDGLLGVESPPGEPPYWYPVECYPVDYHREVQLTAEQWSSLVVRSPQELRLAAAEHRLPTTMETQEQNDLALWIVTRILCDEKTLDTRDDAVSIHLYHRLHYVYAFGAGEASGVELITIVILSVFLFYSSFFSEVHRTLNQVTLSVTMRNYEGLRHPYGAEPTSSLK